MSSVDECELELKSPRTTGILKGEIDTDTGRDTSVQNVPLKWSNKWRLPSACKKTQKYDWEKYNGFKSGG